MPARIRLQRKGKKRAPYYHIVVADARAPRDGRYIERLGAYNPNVNPAMIEVDRDKALDWLQKGAQPSDTCRAILSYKGVLYMNHLANGVKKGAFDEDEAKRRFDAWVQEKEASVEAKRKSLEDAANMSAKERKAAEVKKAEDMAAAITAKLAAAMPAPDDAPAVAEGEEAPVEGEVVEAVAPEATAEEAAPAEAPVEEAAPEAPKEEVKPDDLTKVEGIGPKIAEALNGAGIATYADLAKAEAAKIGEIIADIKGNHVPDTWPKQAEMAAAGKWDELKKWQDELDGGKPAEAAADDAAKSE